MRFAAIAAASAALAVLVALAALAAQRHRAAQLAGVRDAAAVFVDHLLAPYARSLDAPDATVRAVIADAIAASPATPDPSHGVAALRLWSPGGRLVYSSVAGDVAGGHDAGDLTQALEGRAVSHLETGEPGNPVVPPGEPLVETYLPIRDPETGALLAVGELYRDARPLMAERRAFERAVSTITGAAALALLGLLSLCLRQTGRLGRQVAEARALAETNARLRADADAARVAAARAGEEVLNRVGAELHDGPVQLLSLAALRVPVAPPGPAGQPGLAALLGDAQDELRRIAAGLLLPDLDGLGTADLVGAAVDRHRDLTGQAVAADLPRELPPLDGPRRVCLYRLVQEGLANAARHAPGTVPRLAVTADATALTLTIANPLPGDGAQGSAGAQPGSGAHGLAGGRDAGQRLGLTGMRHRLTAFGGDARLALDGGMARLTAILPLDPPATP